MAAGEGKDVKVAVIRSGNWCSVAAKLVAKNALSNTHFHDEEDYPALIHVQNPGLRASTVEMRLAEVERRSNISTKLLYGFMERDVVILAEEILKWSVNKCRDIDGDGRQLFDSNPDVRRMVLLGCRAYGEFGANPSWSDVEAYKTMSQVVIKARNSTARFQDCNALDVMVRSCGVAIEEWPELEEKYPTQVRIISNYKAFKQLLPECFQ